MNVQNHLGTNALMMGVVYKREEIVRMLIRKGADVNK